MNNHNIVTYQELDFDNGFNIRLEHEYFENTKLHLLRVKRKYIEPETGNETKESYSDITFNLDSVQLKEFCNFFVRIKENIIHQGRPEYRVSAEQRYADAMAVIEQHEKDKENGFK
jgi:hypothetical protein